MITSLKLYSHCSHTAAQGSRAAALGNYSSFSLVLSFLHCTHFITLLHMQLLQWQQGCCHWQPFSAALSLSLSRCAALLVFIYRQEWCHQLRFFFNNGGCQTLTFEKVAYGWCSSSSSCWCRSFIAH